MATYDYESGILGALSDTAFSPKSVQRPRARNRDRDTSDSFVVPTAKPKQSVLLSNIPNKDIERMNISDFKKDRLIRDKRAVDYAPGGKWEDNFVNRLLPGVNDKYSVLSDSQLNNWYSSRGLERGNYGKGLLNTVMKVSPIGNVISLLGDVLGKKEEPVVADPTPEELYDFAKDMNRSVKNAGATSDDGFMSGLLNTPNDMVNMSPNLQDYLVNQNMTQEVDRILDTNAIANAEQMLENQYPSTFSDSFYYWNPLLSDATKSKMLRDRIDSRPLPIEEVTPEVTGLLGGIGANESDLLNLLNVNMIDPSTNTSEIPIDFRASVSPIERKSLKPFSGNERVDVTQEMIDTIIEKTGMNTPVDINRNLAPSLLVNPFRAKIGEELPIIEGNPQINLLAYMPNMDGTGQTAIPYSGLNYANQLRYNQLLQDMNDIAQAYNFNVGRN